MTEQRPAHAASDLEYDLAHEVVGRPPTPGAEPARSGRDRPDDDGGDYSYDLAHDVPGR
jgi:hypothetical protein